MSIYTKKTKSLTQKQKTAPMFTAALFTIVKTWKQLQCPPLMDEWIKKTWNTHIHKHIQKNIIQPLKKKEILPCMTVWLDLKGIMQSEIRPRDKNRYCILFSCRILKYAIHCNHVISEIWLFRLSDLSYDRCVLQWHAGTTPFQFRRASCAHIFLAPFSMMLLQ